MNKSESQVRDHLQGIRGIAVIAVVTFHFFPTALPFGYLGVDVFFVLSGFLISLVLSQSTLTHPSIALFYFKRIRRILPLFLIICLLSSIYDRFYRTGISLFYSTRSAIQAVCLSTNLKLIEEDEDYFRSLANARNLFTHTWSLSVEMQFFLIVPILVYFPSLLGSSMRKIVAYFILSFSSFLLFILLPQDKAFNSTFARLWQFLAGMIACEFERSYDASVDTESPKMLSERKPENARCVIHCLLAYLFFVVASSAFLEQVIVLRSAITLLTALCILHGSHFSFLSFPPLLYVGDISYSLYLIHWPVVCILHELSSNSIYLRTISVILCLIVSSASYELIENWYRNLEVRGTFILIAFLYASCLIVLSSSSYSFIRSPFDATIDASFTIFDDNEAISINDTMSLWNNEYARNITIEDALSVNAKMDREWTRNLELTQCRDVQRFEHCDLPNGNGTLRFLIIGNSYALNIGHPIVKHFRSFYSSISVFSKPTCGALQKMPEKYEKRCRNMHVLFEEEVKRIKPDVLFIVERYLPSNTSFNGIASDVEMSHMIERMDFFSKLAQKVFIFQAIPLAKNIFKRMTERVAKGIPLQSNMEESIVSLNVPSRTRLLYMAKSCTNCVLIDVYKRHIDDETGKFMVLHPHTKIAYFEAATHYTPYGLRMIEPFFQRMAQSFHQLLNASNTNNVYEWS